MTALDHSKLEELGNRADQRIGEFVQLTVASNPLKSPGHNPATGKQIEIAAKPANVDLRARPPAKARGAPPTAQTPNADPA